MLFAIFDIIKPMKETTIYLAKKNLLHNYKILSEMMNGEIWPVLKSNAYGHGLTEITTILQNNKATYFVVQNYFEAEQIWKTTRRSVLMLGTESFNKYQDMDFSLITITVGSLELLEYLCSLSKEIKIHIKINTGMNRQGFDPQDISKIILLLEANIQIIPDGLLTHFSDADNSDTSFVAKQINCFKICIAQFSDTKINPLWIHSSNSAGLSHKETDFCNASRVGLALYGFNPLKTNNTQWSIYKNLIPVLSFSTHLTHVRILKPGEIVGYGNTPVTAETTLGTIPVGYYEGLPRSLSNRSICSDNTGNPFAVVGQISMNLTTIDISTSNLSVGDEVIVYSNNLDFPNTVHKNSLLTQTIDYELTTNLKPHIRRVIL